jgi:iron complex outermembrane receptor protein
MRKALLSITLLLFAAISFAQETGTLSGVIKDADGGLTIIGANVVLESDKGQGSATDLDGKFQLVLPVGAQNVVITSIGYAPQTKMVEIKAGETTTLNLEMKIEAKQLGTVVVSAGKFEQRMEDLTVSVSVIKPQILENRVSTTAEDAIEQTPGLTILDSEPQMRGGSGYSFGAGSRVMLLVDDLPILSGDAGRPSWGFLPIENLEQIEVIKGASSVLYGSAALNGIINIRTAYPKDKPQTKINLYTGFYSAPDQENARWRGNDELPIFSGLNFFHSRKIGLWDLVFGGNAFIDNGFIGYEPSDTMLNDAPFILADSAYPLDNNGNIIRDADGNPIDIFGREPRKEFNNRIRLNMNLRKRSKRKSGLSYGVNVNAMYSRNTSTLLWLNSEEGLYRPFGGSITRTIQTSYNIDPFITYSGMQGARHALRGRMFHQNNDNDNNQANKATVYFGEYQFAQRFQNIKDFTVTVGASGQFSDSEAELYAGNENGDGINTSTNAAVYVQVDKKFWNRVNLNGGIRAEYFSVNKSDTIIRPVFRIGANTELWKEGYLRASFGEGFRYPTIAERYINTEVGGLPIVPNPEIQPERSWATEVGLRQGVKIGKFMGYIDIAGFWQEYDNYVEFNFGKFKDVPSGVLGVNAFKSVNTGPALVRGVDASLIGNGQFTDWFGMNVILGYTFSRPEAKDPNYIYHYDNNGDPLTQISTASSLNNLPNNPVTAEDTAAYLANPVLKYRVEHLVNTDLELVFKVNKKYTVSIGATYRYYSAMRNVDAVFYSLDGLLGWGAIDFRKERTGGEHVFDLRASADLTANIKVAIAMNNVANRVYALRPLKISSPRTTTIQLTVKF